MSFIRLALTSLAVLMAPLGASAHVFGQQVRLPLPVELYITGGVCAFIASCAVLLLFSDPESGSKTRKLPRGVPFPRVFQWLLATLGFAALILSLFLAYFGTQDFVTSPLPNFFWVVFLLLFTYSTGLVLDKACTVRKQ